MSGAKALLDERNDGWIHRSMLVTSWQSAGPALDEVQAQEENAIVAAVVGQYAADTKDPK